MIREATTPYEAASLGANRAAARESLGMWRRRKRLAQIEAELRHPGGPRTPAEDLAIRRRHIDALLREGGRR